MARKFLYTIGLLTVLVIVGFFALRIWSTELSAFAFVPGTEFEELQALATNAYDDPAMWISRPSMAGADPARWQPAFADPATSAEPESAAPQIAVFFIHPTTFFEKARWNAPLDDLSSREMSELFVKGLASPFNRASAIWAPRYRQATLGSFLTDDPAADKALDQAYRDVEQAFAVFLANTPNDQPIVLAGHSQGSLHLLRLLREHVKGTPLTDRVVAAYAIGWPVSLEHDLPELGMPACHDPAQTQCVISWLSFAEPADPGQMLTRYRNSPGLDGQPRGDSAILCSNPLTGGIGGDAPASSNRGTLVPDIKAATGQLVPGTIPAKCDAQGLLVIGEPPALDAGVLPGNNYHLFDIPLFWQDLKIDVARRAVAWHAAQ